MSETDTKIITNLINLSNDVLITGKKSDLYEYIAYDNNILLKNIDDDFVAYAVLITIYLIKFSSNLVSLMLNDKIAKLEHIVLNSKNEKLRNFVRNIENLESYSIAKLKENNTFKNYIKTNTEKALKDRRLMDILLNMTSIIYENIDGFCKKIENVKYLKNSL